MIDSVSWTIQEARAAATATAIVDSNNVRSALIYSNSDVRKLNDEIHSWTIHDARAAPTPAVDSNNDQYVIIYIGIQSA